MGAKEAVVLLVAYRFWYVSSEDATAGVRGPLVSSLQQFQNPTWHRHLQGNGTNSPNVTTTELDNCQVSATAGTFTCVVPTEFVYSSDYEVIFSVTCDLNQAIGPNIAESSGCVCDAMVNNFANNTLEAVGSCGCSPCPNATTVEFSLDCTGADFPFFRPGCASIDCSGQCMGANITMMPGSTTTSPTATGQTVAPTITATSPPTVEGQTIAPTSPGQTVAPTAPTATTTTPPAPVATPSPGGTGNTTDMPMNGTSTNMPSTGSNMTTATAPTSKPTWAPRSDCFVRGQAGYGAKITDGSILCDGSDACQGGVVANCDTVTCGERDCTSTTITNATTVVCTGESACRSATIGEEDNPVDTVHCRGKDWTCYNATIFANTTIICEDDSGECLEKENGICGFAKLTTPCLQCIGTNHGCGSAEGCKLSGEDCPNYRYGGSTCEAACPEDNECKLNDTTQKCGDARSQASSLPWFRVGVTATIYILSFLML